MKGMLLIDTIVGIIFFGLTMQLCFELTKSILNFSIHQQLIASESVDEINTIQLKTSQSSSQNIELCNARFSGYDLVYLCEEEI